MHGGAVYMPDEVTSSAREGLWAIRSWKHVRIDGRRTDRRPRLPAQRSPRHDHGKPPPVYAARDPIAIGAGYIGEFVLSGQNLVIQPRW